MSKDVIRTALILFILTLWLHVFSSAADNRHLDNVSPPTAPTWFKIIARDGYDNPLTAIQTWDGKYVIAGISASFKTTLGCKHDCHDAWIAKLDSYGSVIWERYYGSDKDDSATGIVETPDGGYAISGIWRIKPPGVANETLSNMDFTVQKVDRDGWNVWSKSYSSGRMHTYGGRVSADTSGRIHVTATTFGYNENVQVNNDYIIRLEKDGGGEQIRNVPGDVSDQVSTFADGRIAYVYTTPKSRRPVLTMEDAHGAVIWSTIVDETEAWFGGAIYTATNNGFIFAHISDNMKGRGRLLNLYKIGLDGEHKWKTEYTYDYFSVNSISATDDNGALIVGAKAAPCMNRPEPEYYGCSSAFLLKIDSSGNRQWEKLLFKKQYAQAASGIQTNDGGYLVTGIVAETYDEASCKDYSCFDAWITKLDKNGDCKRCF